MLMMGAGQRNEANIGLSSGSHFALVFQEAAEALAAPIEYAAFDASVVRIRRDDLAKFIVSQCSAAIRLPCPYLYTLTLATTRRWPEITSARPRLLVDG